MLKMNLSSYQFWRPKAPWTPQNIPWVKPGSFLCQIGITPGCETVCEQPLHELKLIPKDFQEEKQSHCLYWNTTGTKAEWQNCKDSDLLWYKCGTPSGIFADIEMCCEVSTVSARERCCIWLKSLHHLSAQCCKTVLHLQKNLHHNSTCCYWKAIWDHFYLTSRKALSQAQLQPLGLCSDICGITGGQWLCALPEMPQQFYKITEHN